MPSEIAIIGAGIAGLALALSLHAVGINSTVYESRDAPLNIGGAVMLSPNGLKILDQIDIYDDIRSKGYAFDTLYFRTVEGELKETYDSGLRRDTDTTVCDCIDSSSSIVCWRR